MTFERREDEIAARMANGDTSAARIPLVRLSTVEKYDGSQVRNMQGELVFCINRRVYANGAKGFGQWRGRESLNLQDYTQFMLELAFMVSMQFGDGMRDGYEMQSVTWTPVPSDGDDNMHTAFILRCVYQFDKGEVVKCVDDFVQRCDKMFEKAILKGKRTILQQPNHYLKLGRSTYVDMCSFYMADDTDRSRGMGSLFADENPYNPFKVFTLERALQQLQNSRAPVSAPDFCDISNWLEGSSVHFPRNGKLTHHILAPRELNPMCFEKFFFPHVERVFKSRNTEWDDFLFTAGVNDDHNDEKKNDNVADDDSEADSNNSKNNSDSRKERLAALYQRLCRSSEMEVVNDMDSVRDRCVSIMQKAKYLAGNDLRQQALNRREAQKQCVDIIMRDLFTNDECADIGDAQKAIRSYYDDFLRTHKNFCMPRAKFTANLSRFADSQAVEAAFTETVWSIRNNHAETKSVRTAIMHVYRYTPFHGHTAMYGGPGTGKSKVQQVNSARLIPGTFMEKGSETAKSKNTPGKKGDMMVEFFEDIPPSQMGISSFSGSKTQQGSTSNTEGESLLKYRLTKGRITTTYKVVKDGKHMQLTVVSWCNTVMVLAMNSALCDVPTSLSSRFVNLVFQHRDRKDCNGQSHGLSGAYQNDKNPKLIPLRNMLKKRDMRNQLFHYLIGLMMYCTVFDSPDMKLSNFIWSETLSLAKARGLHETNNIRHLERMHFFAETLMEEDVIDRVLDSELSPLVEDAPWHPYHLLEFDKHLWVNTEHATTAMGMLQHMYENEIVAALEKFFKKTLLKDKIKNNEFGKQCSNETLKFEMDDYYIIKTDLTSGVSSFQQAQSQQNDILLQRLADFCYSAMDPKPEKQEIHFALLNMMSLMIEVPDRKKEGQLKRIPSLGFTVDGTNETMIAVAMMNNYAKDRLRTCMKEVLCHKYTKPKNILYGRMSERNPYIYSAMKIEPNPNRILKMPQSDYFSPELIRMTKQALSNVNHSQIDADYSMLSKVNCEDDAFFKNFSDTSHKVVDIDLDEMAAINHAHRIGLPFLEPTTDSPNCNTSPASFNGAILEMIENADSLPVYPKMFKEIFESKYRLTLKKDEEEHPERYSLNATLQKRNEPFRKKRRMHPPPPAADDFDMELSSEAGGENNGAAAAAAEPEPEEHDNGVLQEFEMQQNEMEVDLDFCSDGDIPDGEAEDDEEQEADLRRKQHFGARRANGSAAASSNSWHLVGMEHAFQDDYVHHGGAAAAAAGPAAYDPYHRACLPAAPFTYVPLDARPNLRE
jgi:hypothetical protein